MIVLITLNSDRFNESKPYGDSAEDIWGISKSFRVGGTDSLKVSGLENVSKEIDGF